VLLSPASARWLPTLTDALGPSYRVTTEATETPAAVVVDSRDDDLVRLIQEQRSSTRVIVVHTGHPSEQPMAPSEILDLGADTYLAPVSLPALAAHLKALTRSWDAFPPRPTEPRLARVVPATGQSA
jgi:DNA-binding response OmpR family regulator